MFKSYTDVRDWLENFIPQTYSKENLGLKRIKYLLALLGNPQDKFKSIHIAGTSGKGSTAFYIARLMEFASIGSSTAIKKRSANLETSSIGLISPRSSLRPHQTLKNNLDGGLSGLRHVFDWQQPAISKKAGGTRSPGEALAKLGGTRDTLKIGLHLSPHLVDIRERMQIFRGGTKRQKDKETRYESLMPMKQFIGLTNEIKPVVESMKTSQVGLPSYFEILVTASFLYFAQEKVDWAVVEVGLGGRLDATNVLKPKLCVITNVGLDHTDILGKTIGEIAFEKAGIIKSGITIVTAATARNVRVIEKVAQSEKAPLIKVNTQRGDKTLKSDIKDYLIIYNDILRGKKVFVTEDVFLLCIKSLTSLGIYPTRLQIIEAFSTSFAGRFEEIDENVVLDGAHNLEKMQVLINFLKNQKLFEPELFESEPQSRGPQSRRPETRNQKLILVVAFKKGKDWQKMVDLLIKNLPIKRVIATKFHAVTDTGIFAAVDPEEIKGYIESKSQKARVEVFYNSQVAVFEALQARGASSETARGRSSNLLLVTGSLYLVGEARTLWQLPEFP